ncbi:DUF2505 domain-containing protein [Nostocoides australiense]|nr:DUF2505 domain-containing protein [Tetrasphaera australiensis]HRW02746.1 DUF2505 domain-containing protein [Tetrasphaera sp.]
MQFRTEMRYPVPPAAVYAMLADPGFREQVCVDQDVISADVDITSNGTGLSVRIDQVQPTQGVPSFAKPVVGETSRAIQIEEWPDESSASLEIKTPGKPATMKGTITLSPEGKGTLEVVELNVKVSVPLVGGRIEKILADLVRRSTAAEQETGLRWLGAGGS